MEQPGASSSGIGSSVNRANVAATELGTADSTLASPEESKYLLVDDNKVNQKVMTTLFDRLGLKYQTAWNGQEAVDTYQANPQRCRLILLDISMPVMGGMEAASVIRQYEKENELSPAIIVGLIATRFEEERRRMVDEFGMDTTLVKPIRFEALKELIGRYGKLA
ncbi:two-component response regulator [Fusarium albosuccineum]|uniref:Two-component response regulator n=1 Tax=Fusarium albosuccineum TaxID=1237068 RepID=A0A8H4P847_9HYPO|nr:two-component response regulator [Fusarium albosuccineum]